MMKSILPILLSSFLMLPGLSAQEAPIGNWMAYTGSKSLGSNFNFHHEIQYRNYNLLGDLEQLLLRTGIGYNLSEKNNNVLIGYGYIHGRSPQESGTHRNSSTEHRIFQQFITFQHFSRLILQHRYRFEQRFTGGDFKMRFRYFLSLNAPINKPELTRKTLYLSAYNEIFINVASNPFDRNRLFGGLGYKFNDKIRAEAGYMNQFLYGQQRDQLNFATFLNF